MALTYQNQTYPSLAEFIEYDKSKANLYSQRLSFAHKIDGAVINALETLAVKNAINKIVEIFVSQQSGIMLSTGLSVNPYNYPKIYNSLMHCCDTLGISMPQTVISPSMPGINAMATGTNEFAFIAISDLAQVLLPEDQLKFIIGHECGHIALDHVVYHTIGQYIGHIGTYIPVVGSMLANTIMLPLNAWNRYSEISSDRAGFLCCDGDLNVAQRALLRLAGGFSDTNNIDIDSYINKSLSSLEDHKVGAMNEYFMSHPLIPKRLKALEYFSKSELYYRITNKPKPVGVNLLSDDTLNDMVNNLIKVM